VFLYIENVCSRSDSVSDEICVLNVSPRDRVAAGYPMVLGSVLVSDAGFDINVEKLLQGYQFVAHDRMILVDGLEVEMRESLVLMLVQ
jgi:hypothetical protein